ncbi:hypothetical protein AABM34_03150 [Lysinibacillus fusiformis]
MVPSATILAELPAYTVDSPEVGYNISNGTVLTIYKQLKIHFHKLMEQSEIQVISV